MDNSDFQTTRAHDMQVPSDAELVAMQQRGELPSDTELASQTTITREHWDHFQRLAKEDHDIQEADIERLQGLIRHYADMCGVSAEELKRVHNV